MRRSEWSPLCGDRLGHRYAETNRYWVLIFLPLNFETLRKGNAMIQIGTVKKSVTILVGFSTRRIVKAIIENNTAPENRKEKLIIGIGSWVLTAIAVSASKDYTDKKIDMYYNAWINRGVVKDEVTDAKTQD